MHIMYVYINHGTQKLVQSNFSQNLIDKTLGKIRQWHKIEYHNSSTAAHIKMHKKQLEKIGHNFIESKVKQCAPPKLKKNKSMTDHMLFTTVLRMAVMPTTLVTQHALCLKEFNQLCLRNNYDNYFYLPFSMQILDLLKVVFVSTTIFFSCLFIFSLCFLFCYPL